MAGNPPLESNEAGTHSGAAAKWQVWFGVYVGVGVSRMGLHLGVFRFAVLVWKLFYSSDF